MSVSRTPFATVGTYQASVLAQLKTWAQALSSSIAACGWAKTSDTGQINIAGLGATPAAGAASGYEIWAPVGDSLQATKPLHIKLEYGNGGGTSNIVGVWLTIGLGGTDGAGNLLAPTSARVPVSGSGTALPGTGDMFVCGDGPSARLWFQFGSSAITGFELAMVERTRDANGNPTAEGATLRTISGLAAYGSAFTVVTYGSSGPLITYPTNAIPHVCFPPGATSSQSASLSLYTCYPWDSKLYNPMTSALIYFNQDTQPLVPIPVNIFGGSHTYMPFGSAYSPTSSSWVLPANANAAPALIWE